MACIRHILIYTSHTAASLFLYLLTESEEQTSNMPPTFIPRDIKKRATSDTIGVIVVSSAIGLAIISIILYSLYRRYQRRRYEQAPAQQDCLPTVEKHLLHVRSHSTLSENEMLQLEKEEIQRQFIIRKSLASRSSSQAESRTSRNSYGESDDECSSQSQSIMEDWKEFEANLCSERSLLVETHPGLRPSPQRQCSYETHPALRPMAAQLSPLVTPPPVRTASPLQVVMAPPSRPRLVSSPPLNARFNVATTPNGVRCDRAPPRRSMFTVPHRASYESLAMSDMQGKI